jgi:hypothetical protein
MQGETSFIHPFRALSSPWDLFSGTSAHVRSPRDPADAALKRLSPSLVQFSKLPSDKIHGVVTRIDR